MHIDLIEDQVLNSEMKESTRNLESVTVYSEKENVNVESLEVGRNTLSIETISTLPSFLGEIDIVKSLLLLPGVSTVGEGAGGFNVRGGGVDQNLILQDGGIIFNPSHVFGFFSVFNPAMVDNVTLYKGAAPAQYGGRLSSVLNVNLKEGNYQDFKISGGIGLISGNLAVSGPIIKNKLSFIVGGRLSYSDWLLQAAKDLNVRKSAASFNDVNLKLTYQLNENNKLSYSGYNSNDSFRFASDTTFKWHTTNHVLNWKSVINEDMGLDVNVVSGKYRYDIEDEKGLNSFEVNSEIGYQTLKLLFEYDINERNLFNAGVEGIYYHFKPGEQRPLSPESGVSIKNIEDEKSLETSIFVEDEYHFSDAFSIKAGLRFSLFNNFGEGSDFIYDEGGSRNSRNIIDTVFYEKGDKIATYNGFEPRVTLNYKINAASAIKASFNRSRQYLHLISNTAAITPTDFWKTSNRYIAPETSDQYSLGYFRNFKDNTIETSVEAYYKSGNDIVDFKNGAVLLLNDNIEADLISGTSEAYGIEMFINKKAGRLTGWISYDFSRTFRTIDGEFEDEEINFGQQYPANYDKPHDFTFALNYKASHVVTFGTNFTYSTGRPVTAPLSLLRVSNLTGIANYSLRNQERIPDYHRLDLSMTIKTLPRVDRNWRFSWTLGVYNLYARRNAYSVFFKNNLGIPPSAFRLAVLGTAFPTVTFNFEF